MKITLFTKSDGPLTKRINLTDNGKLHSDGSACVMARGAAQRIDIANVEQFAALIGGLGSDQAITLGTLREGLPDQVNVVTKAKLLNGTTQPNVIARTSDDIVYMQETAALALLDFDTKGLPTQVRAVLNRQGGFWAALCSVLPVLTTIGRVTRHSTSSGLFRSDTGEQIPGSDGLHIYPVVRDGNDIERFLKALHDRCFLAGLGWMRVGAGGQLLERSIIDRMVGAPERLVFEGNPILEPPLQQDGEKRRPVVVAGDILNTLAACPPLTIVETAKLHELKAKEAQRLGSEVARVRTLFIDTHSQRLIERGMPAPEARRLVHRQCEGVLLPGLVLTFDEPELAGSTVGDVLNHPERFDGNTLADPLEGPGYGPCVAKVFRRPDGTPWIHSFAHGRTFYQLKYDAGAVGAAMETATAENVVQTFVDLAVAADLDAHELEELRDLAVERSGVSKSAVNRQYKVKLNQHSAEQTRQQQERRAATRNDPRPAIDCPIEDAPWLPQMAVLNEVLGTVVGGDPPMRNLETTVATLRKMTVPNTHAFTSDTSNFEEEVVDKTTKLPAPEQWGLHALNQMELAELIERYIDYVDKNGRSVHMPTPFVRHYLKREDGVLPTVSAISTLPIVLADGGLLAPEGLDRLRGIFFKIPKELRAIIPERSTCTDDAVRKAIVFLCDEWLCDVLTDFTGKCIIIVAALTLIERSLLSERPAFCITAGRRGGGKTTLLVMLIMAVTGMTPAGSAWSPDKEERRKSLLAYLLYGVAYILWDNIPRNSKISCPHIERSLTLEWYSDRKLGVSETPVTSASTIQFFTGNNIRPGDDLASRSLLVRLNVDRPDPENRSFKHPDGVGWTKNHRVEIMQALYTILLGNPALDAGRDAESQTRFKMWWRLVGSAVEHAAKLAENDIDFRKLFLAQEDEDTDVIALVEALEILRNKWPGTFRSTEVAELVNLQGIHQDSVDGRILRDFLFPELSGKPEVHTMTAAAVGVRLGGVVDNMVSKDDGRALALRRKVDAHKKSIYNIEVKGVSSTTPHAAQNENQVPF